ncbi:hypothetical protein NDU88_006893 [Pleurodeles waltl]|uniref:Uncharacterized protein n=1 Tax=Pleurodeles waltl TaxID=8319 RepID=A0AAV7UNX6_PLEWA|nr:hypothetical protein NDU88_006893 [Pleurodeles waltl]
MVIRSVTRALEVQRNILKGLIHQDKETQSKLVHQARTAPTSLKRPLKLTLPDTRANAHATQRRCVEVGTRAARRTLFRECGLKHPGSGRPPLQLRVGGESDGPTLQQAVRMLLDFHTPLLPAVVVTRRAVLGLSPSPAPTHSWAGSPGSPEANSADYTHPARGGGAADKGHDPEAGCLQP